MIHSNILAVRVERRRIALAAFCGIKLEYADVRELSNDERDAAASARAFLIWAIETFKPAAVAVERVHPRAGRQREHLTNVAFGTFFGHAIRRVLIRQSTIRSAMGEPPLRSGRELRQVGTSLWPRLPGTRNAAAYDVAMLGLHFQMLDLFMS